MENRITKHCWKKLEHFFLFKQYSKWVYCCLSIVVHIVRSNPHNEHFSNGFLFSQQKKAKSFCGQLLSERISVIAHVKMCLNLKSTCKQQNNGFMVSKNEIPYCMFFGFLLKVSQLFIPFLLQFSRFLNSKIFSNAKTISRKLKTENKSLQTILNSLEWSKLATKFIRTQNKTKFSEMMHNSIRKSSRLNVFYSCGSVFDWQSINQPVVVVKFIQKKIVI